MIYDKHGGELSERTKEKPQYCEIEREWVERTEVIFELDLLLLAIFLRIKFHYKFCIIIKKIILPLRVLHNVFNLLRYSNR